MHPSVAITLIICGTVLGATPLLVLPHPADVAFLCYFGLSATMVLSGIVGSFVPHRPRYVRGFEPLPAAAVE